MIDRQTIEIAATIGGAVAVVLTVMSGLYTVFSDDLSSLGAMVIAAMGLILFALLVLAIDNRLRINEMESEN